MTTDRDLLLSLDRCVHGRHSVDPCLMCPGGKSTGNARESLGNTVHGVPITPHDVQAALGAVLAAQADPIHARPSDALKAVRAVREAPLRELDWPPLHRVARALRRLVARVEAEHNVGCDGDHDDLLVHAHLALAVLDDDDVREVLMGPRGGP